ncbi:hypothetical protein TWF694_007211 [Orbilia ellipsospora]|uniref:BZIP domain-containing protein n=1 Tax=Orbilia ellipsospora TaxID=2528407 RepID=A0AAV9XHL2_9PEZI
MATPQLKRLRKGRPRKEGTEVEKANARREQVRRAQREFRLRQQAERETETKYLTILEEVVEGMSVIFTEVIDAGLHSKICHQDPTLLNLLHTSMQRFIVLADRAACFKAKDFSAEIEPGEFEIDEDSPQLLDSSDLTVPDSAGTVMPDFYSQPPANPPSSGGIVRHTREPKEHVASASNLEKSFSHGSIFGNGWLDQAPKNISFIGPQQFGFNYENHKIAITLLHTTLSTAYDALLNKDERNDPTPLGKSMFQYALLYYSKQELLYTLRWFLGPGSSQIYRLRFINNTPKPVTCSASDIISRFFTPVVDSNDIHTPQQKTPTFLDAFGIELYLKRRGAKFLDSHKMEIPSVEEFPPLLAVKSSHTISAPAIKSLDGSIGLPNSNEVARITYQQDYFAMPPTNLIDFLSLNVFTGGKQATNDTPSTDSFRSLSTKESGVAKAKPLIIHISKLLENLTLVSNCLLAGPGYQWESIEMAILASAA